MQPAPTVCGRCHRRSWSTSAGCCGCSDWVHYWRGVPRRCGARPGWRIRYADCSPAAEPAHALMVASEAGFLALRDRAYAFLAEHGPADEPTLLAHVYGGPAPLALGTKLAAPLAGDP